MHERQRGIATGCTGSLINLAPGDPFRWVNGNRMILRLFAGIMLLIITAAAPTVASDEGPVWFWFATCGGPVLRLEVRLDQKIIYESSFPLCRAERSSAHSKGQTKKLDFVFNAPRAIVWQGYRDEGEDNTTGQNQEIEGNIWLAGADPDAMILGVSFLSRGSIYMNSLHIAYPDRRAVAEIEPGLLVITEPVAHHGEKSN